MKNTGMYQKGSKHYDEIISIKNSQGSSGVPQPIDRGVNSKKPKLQLDQRNWMGSSTQQLSSAISHFSQTKTSPKSAQALQMLQSAFMSESGTPKSRSNNSSKAPSQVIEDILKGLVKNNVVRVNPFYWQESQQKLSEILTNKTKLGSYISELETQASEADPQIAKNYEILIILLKEMKKSDIEVKHSSRGLELDFNRRQMLNQQAQIDKLERKIEEKDEHIKEIIEEYESIIRNFNDVLQKLLEEKDKQGKLSKYQESMIFSAGFK